VSSKSIPRGERKERRGNVCTQTSGTWGLVLGPGLLVLTVLCADFI